MIRLRLKDIKSFQQYYTKLPKISLFFKSSYSKESKSHNA